MRKHLFISAITMLSGLATLAQQPSGKHVLSFRLAAGNSQSDMVFTQSGQPSNYTDRGNAITNELSYGWIMKKNIILSAGIGVSTSTLKLENNAGDKKSGSGFSVYPFISLQKNISLKSGKISYAPYTLAGISFLHEDINNTSGSAPIQSTTFTSGFLKLRPVSFLFRLSTKFSIGAEIGEYSIHLGSFSRMQQNAPTPQTKEISSEMKSNWNSCVSIKAQVILGKK